MIAIVMVTFQYDCITNTNYSQTSFSALQINPEKPRSSIT